jgi:NAD-dependent dihydropyrimidine dehydrogenase PreA subunit
MSQTMDQINSIIICKCQVYHRVDEKKLAQVTAAFQSSGIFLRVVDDLCYEAVHHPEKLRATDAVVGCHHRTLAALCTYAGVKHIPRVFDVNIDIDEIVASLNSASANTDNDESSDPISDDWVAWYPVIDQDRCIECGKCADFCMFGVYTFEDKTIKVVKPAGCKTDCPACARMCPANAIIFPKSSEAHINGSLREAVRPQAEQNASLRSRLQSRKAATRLFREDE